jgi:hypothetical protein
MLHLKLITIETSSLKEKVVGFSFFPIFIDSTSRMPVLVQDKTPLKDIKRALHKGNY